MTTGGYEDLSREELEARLAAYEQPPDEAAQTRPQEPEPSPVRRKRRWGRRRIAWVTLAVLAVVTVLAVGDWWLRNREMDNLLAKVEASEAAMGSAKEDMASTIGLYQNREPWTQQLYNEMLWAMAQSATRGGEEVITTGDAVREVRVLPWHRSVAKAKDRYLDHSQAWQDYWTKVADDPTDVNAGPEIDATFRIARPAFEDAVPSWALHDLEQRVDDVFADVPASD